MTDNAGDPDDNLPEKSTNDNAVKSGAGSDVAEDNVDKRHSSDNLPVLITKLSVIVFAILFFSMAWFQHRAPGWNVNTRLALTFALAEDGSVKVDRYIKNPEMETGDVAFYQGHYYSDKIIGTSLTGVPAYWATSLAENIVGKPFSIPVKRYWITTLSVGLLTALSGVLLFRLLVRWYSCYLDKELSCSDCLALALVSVAVILGSLLFPYGTLFMSYGAATFFLLAMMVLSEKSFDKTGKARWGVIFIAAFAGGFAVLCEYTYAAAVGLWCLLLAYRQKNIWVLLPCATAGALALLPFIAYTMTIFGKPTIPYEYHAMAEFQTNMAQGLMGAKYPRLSVLWFVTFHPYRGLFVHSPLLFLGFAGLIGMARNARMKPVAWFCIALSIFYFLFNSAYYMWWGGWGFSPRHLAPAVPLLAVGVLYWLRSGIGRILAAAAGLIGVALHVMVNATEPQIPDRPWYDLLMNPSLSHTLPTPFFTDILPRFTAGAFDANAGDALGLSPYAGLAVYSVVVIGLVFIAIKVSRPAAERQ